MIRKNVLELPKIPVRAHGGEGEIAFARPFTDEELRSRGRFVDYVEIPPGASIGVHTHGEDEEIYFIVEGRGRMRTNDEEYEVRAGDLVLNRPGWTHGLRNEGPGTLRVLVWEVAL